MQSVAALITVVAASVVWVALLTALWFGIRRWRRSGK